MTAPNPQRLVEISRQIAAPASRVFDAWLDVDALVAFIRPAATVTVPRASVDARVGGQFLIVMLVGDSEIPHSGEYEVIEPHRRLVFTWRSPQITGRSVVHLDFETLDDHTTLLTLRHEGFPSPQVQQNHHQGWTSILQTLADFVNS